MVRRLKATIRPTAPYDFAKLVERVRSHNELITVEGDNVVRTIHIGEKPVLLRVDSIGSVEEPELAIEVIGIQTDGEMSEAIRQVEHMFTSQADISAFYKHVEEDACLSKVIHQYYGLRMATDADLFESMTRTIIGQQLNIGFAATLTRRIIALGADELEVDGKRYPVFPTPEQVARLTVEDLRLLQYSQRKAEYIIDFARMVVDGNLILDELYAQTDEEIIERLVKLRGIGRWTVECFLLFGMARPNLLPALDIGLRNAVRKVYQLDHQATEEEVRTIGERWSPYRSYASYYLWESLNDVKKPVKVKKGSKKIGMDD